MAVLRDVVKRRRRPGAADAPPARSYLFAPAADAGDATWKASALDRFAGSAPYRLTILDSGVSGVLSASAGEAHDWLRRAGVNGFVSETPLDGVIPDDGVHWTIILDGAPDAMRAFWKSFAADRRGSVAARCSENGGIRVMTCRTPSDDGGFEQHVRELAERHGVTILGAWAR